MHEISTELGTGSDHCHPIEKHGHSQWLPGDGQDDGNNLPFRKGAKSWAGSFLNAYVQLNLSLLFALTTCYDFENFSPFVFPDVQFSAYRLKKPLLH